MKRLSYFFMVLAGLGFALSVSAHILALTGLPIPGGEKVMALHVGILLSGSRL